MLRTTSLLGVIGVLCVSLAQSVSGCSNADCNQCDKAGTLEWCTSCTTDQCTETIQDKSSGSVVFTCNENVGSSCATGALLMYCDAVQ